MSSEHGHVIKAAIDIGTNTAHLIVGRVFSDKPGFELIEKRRHYIFLAEGGIHQISEDATARLFKALEDFFICLKRYDDPAVKICATEALRKAGNGPFIQGEILRKFNWETTVISGEEEARLILQGVRASTDLSKGRYLIMDVGGGSVEFIGVDAGRPVFIHSFPIGIATLYNRFHRSEPISANEINGLNAFLNTFLSGMTDLWKEEYPVLIGCAGTFELLGKISDVKEDDLSFGVNLEEFEDYAEKVVGMSLSERMNSPFIPEARAPYLVVAVLLIRYVLKHHARSDFIVSRYALKEGILLS